MKKLTLLFILLSSVLSTYAFPVISMTKAGGCFFYNVVESKLGSYPRADGTNSSGWIVTCEGCGTARCKAPSISNPMNTTADLQDADSYDFNIAEGLIEHADDAIENGNSSGSYSVTNLIEGQDFKRIYTVTWQTLSNGTITQIVDLIYVSNI